MRAWAEAMTEPHFSRRMCAERTDGLLPGLFFAGNLFCGAKGDDARGRGDARLIVR